jgi:hypothetical protein
MEYVVFEANSRQVYTGDIRDRDELSHMGRDAKVFNFAQAEEVAQMLARQYSYRYSFQVVAKSALPL